jgi:hypothetical protein
MTAEATVQPVTHGQGAASGLVGLLLSLSAAAGAITRQHYRCPTERERLALGDAVAAIIRHGRLHGLSDAPAMGPAEAEQTFRAALRHALSARVSRQQLAAIFNNEENAAEAVVRKDLE